MYLQETEDHERIRSQRCRMRCMRQSYKNLKRAEFLLVKKNLFVLGLSGKIYVQDTSSVKLECRDA